MNSVLYSQQCPNVLFDLIFSLHDAKQPINYAKINQFVLCTIKFKKKKKNPTLGRSPLLPWVITSVEVLIYLFIAKMNICILCLPSYGSYISTFLYLLVLVYWG